MRCLICGKLSFRIVCLICREGALKPSLFERKIGEGFKIYSFYEYSHIKPLLQTKYQHIGSTIYRILALQSFKTFAQNFEYGYQIFAIPIDDDPKEGYSHSAILAKSVCTKNIKPLFGVLIAQNKQSYAGKDYAFRLNNPRDFRYCGKNRIEAIIIDDIVTTGLTMLEAKETLKHHDVEALFGLVLADAAL